jgi:hypothetical protein
MDLEDWNSGERKNRLVSWLVQCVIAISLFVLNHFIIKVQLQLQLCG